MGRHIWILKNSMGTAICWAETPPSPVYELWIPDLQASEDTVRALREKDSSWREEVQERIQKVRAEYRMLEEQHKCLLERVALSLALKDPPPMIVVDMPSGNIVGILGAEKVVSAARDLKLDFSWLESGAGGSHQFVETAKLRELARALKEL